MIGSIYRTHHLITAVLVSTLYSLDFSSQLCQIFQRNSRISDYENRQVPTHGCYKASTGLSVFPDCHSVWTETCWATSITHRESTQDILEYTRYLHLSTSLSPRKKWCDQSILELFLGMFSTCLCVPISDSPHLKKTCLKIDLLNFIILYLILISYL